MLMRRMSRKSESLLVVRDVGETEVEGEEVGHEVVRRMEGRDWVRRRGMALVVVVEDAEDEVVADGVEFLNLGVEVVLDAEIE